MQHKEKKLSDFAGSYRYLTILGCVFSGISAVLLFLPFLCIWKIAYEVLAVYPDISKAEGITKYAWMAVLFAIAGILVYFAALMSTHLAAFRTARNMRGEALSHLLKLPLGYFEMNGSGKIRRIIDESSGQTETYLAHMLPDLVGAVVTPVVMVICFLSFDFRLGILCLIPIIISILFLRGMMGQRMADAMKEYQNALEDMNNEAVEYVRGIPVVKTFGQTVFSFENFHAAIMRYKKWAVKYTLSLRIPMCNYTVIINSVFAFLVCGGVWIAFTSNDIKQFLSDFIFYCIISSVITVVMNKIMFSSENLMLAKDAVNRINSFLKEKPLIEPMPSNEIAPKNMDIAFCHVGFTYPGSQNQALKDVSFCIKEGETVALVGPSGSGKTTVASLIPRFFEADTGSVRIGDADVRNISSARLMDTISFVFQNAKLFQMSLLDNIRFARPDATRDQVLEAAKAAQCEEIFEKFPQGIDTVVGSKGVFLSGGEAQRIALARAILKDAPVILLDEATAFADPENEHKIQQAFEHLIKGKTVLMIAHRLSTVVGADQIFVMQDGRIAEHGSHNDLVGAGGIYQNMWKEYHASIAWKVSEGSVASK